MPPATGTDGRWADVVVHAPECDAPIGAAAFVHLLEVELVGERLGEEPRLYTSIVTSADELLLGLLVDA